MHHTFWLQRLCSACIESVHALKYLVLLLLVQVLLLDSLSAAAGYHVNHLFLAAPRFLQSFALQSSLLWPDSQSLSPSSPQLRNQSLQTPGRARLPDGPESCGWDESSIMDRAAERRLGEKDMQKYISRKDKQTDRQIGMDTYIRIRTCIHTDRHACIESKTHIYIYANTDIHTYIHTYTHTDIERQVDMCICTAPDE